MSELEDVIARYQAIVEEMREQSRVAHEAIRDMKAERRLLSDFRKEWLSHDELVARLDETAERVMSEYEVGVKEAIDIATRKVYERFDQIMLIAMGEDVVSLKEGRRTVIELITDFVKARQIPIHITIETHLMMNSKTAERERQLNRKLTRRASGDFDELPILIDNRCRDDRAYLFIPNYLGRDDPYQIEVDLKTQEGLADASRALKLQASWKFRAIPQAFGGTAPRPKKGGRRTSPPDRPSVQ